MIDSLVRGGYLETDDTDHLRLLPVEIRVTPGVRMLVLEFETSEVATDRQSASAPESSVSAARVDSTSRPLGRR